MVNDTIAAISTGMTASGIGIVRMSGGQAVEIADRIFVSPSGKKLSEAPSHTIHYGHICDGDHLIDEVMVMLMRAPSTYTREDVVEIDCHGGIVVMRRLLDTVIKYGARPAEPGEFTKRAFLNGRIDLSQAEAVIDVINSGNQMALDSSLRQLKGKMKETVTGLRGKILEDIAYIEAALDDPEHYTLDDFRDDLKAHVEEELKLVDQLLASADNGRLIKEGIRTVIVGKPNAGKSSLLNLLLGENRAIVTDIAGTTRDTLEESMTIGGVPLCIIDTAGIRETMDIVERMGVDKAIELVESADLILYVADRSTSLDENDHRIMHLIRDQKVIVLLNKSDLEAVTDASSFSDLRDVPVIDISAVTGEGLDQLEQFLKDMFFGGELKDNNELWITNTRHKHELAQTSQSLSMVMESIEGGLPEDFFAIDLMDAYKSLGNIIGESVEDDLVDKIFSDFCMGK